MEQQIERPEEKPSPAKKRKTVGDGMAGLRARRASGGILIRNNKLKGRKKKQSATKKRKRECDMALRSTPGSTGKRKKAESAGKTRAEREKESKGEGPLAAFAR